MSDAPTQQLSLPIGLRVMRKLPIPHKIGVLGRLYGKPLSRSGVAWVETSAGPVWKLDLRNHTHRWIVFGDYEGPKLLAWLRSWIREDSVVVDSGANIGQVLLYLAPLVRRGEYIAVEPHPVARQWLKDCLARHPSWRVRVESFGFGDKPGRASLGGQWGGDAAVGSHTELELGNGEIEVVTMDDYAKLRGLKKIDVWKLDMEGSEEAALRGAKEMLSARTIKALVLETDPDRFESMAKTMNAYGYRALDWKGHELERQNVVTQRNVLFVPSIARDTQ